MNAKFYLVTPIGFEKEAAAELRELWPFLLNPAARPHDVAFPELEFDKGGISFETELFAALQINFFHSTASRLLWRLAEFKATAFPELHSKLLKVDWKRFLGQQKSLRLKVAASQSRLGQEKRILAVVEDAWKLKHDPGAAFGVFVRIQRDVVTLSLDTSGEHLHKRGEAIEKGEAPMRETLASHVLRVFTADRPLAALREIELVDPFCGSGTLLLEASRRGAGHFARPYDFQGFQGIPKLFKAPQFARNYILPPPGYFASYQGADIAADVLKSAQANWKSAWRESGPPVLWHLEDATAASNPPPAGARERWLVCNPPYGERLAAESPGRLIEAAVERWKPSRLGVLWPRKFEKALAHLPGASLKAAPCLKNGGIECLFQIYEFPQKP